MRLCLSLTRLLDQLYDICIKLACVFGPALLRCEDLVERKSRCFSERSHSGGLSEDDKKAADICWCRKQQFIFYIKKTQRFQHIYSCCCVFICFYQSVEMTEICCFGNLNVAWLVNTATRWWPCMQYLEQNLGVELQPNPRQGES